MKRLTLVMALLSLAGFLSISVAPAAAEFKAHNKSSEGGGAFQIVVEGVGNTLDCGSLETNQLAWQIKKGGKAAESGSELAFNFKSWGTCVVQYEEEEKAKLQEAKLSGGECAWETTESGSEQKVAVKIASTCTLKGEIGKKSCEVTLAPKANEKLSALTLNGSGKTSENLSVDIGLEKVTVGASGEGCAIAGIKSTSAAKLAGVVEAEEVSSGVPTTVFVLYKLDTGRMTAVGQKKTVGVLNTGPTDPPGARLLTGGATGLFKITANPLATCQMNPLPMNTACQMTVEFTNFMGGPGIKTIMFEIVEGTQTFQLAIIGSP